VDILDNAVVVGNFHLGVAFHICILRVVQAVVGAVREVEFRMREQHPVAVFDYSHLAEVQTGAVLDLVALQEAHVQAAAKDFVDFDSRLRWKPNT